VEDAVDFIGAVVIGAILIAPLLYGLSTLMGMTHKQFRPVFRRKQPTNQGGHNGDDQTLDET